jgi:hypothetical protein
VYLQVYQCTLVQCTHYTDILDRLSILPDILDIFNRVKISVLKVVVCIIKIIINYSTALVQLSVRTNKY